MTLKLSLPSTGLIPDAISPFREMGAYEALWTGEKITFKSIADLFSKHPDNVPSDFVSEREAEECAAFVVKQFAKSGVTRYGVRIHGAGEYPSKLRDAAHPLEFLYYQGKWNLVNSRAVAVVGTRKPSPDGVARTKRLVQCLVEDKFVIVSGLAAGVDRVAHETAITENGYTIAVIGTPLSDSYPKENSSLQEKIANEFLVISQVPVKRYESQDYRYNRTFFPERNVTMSALSEATVIVEASDTSGTLIQARAAQKQGRKLFILDSCFRNKRLSWPDRFAKRGAIRVETYEDIRQHLSPSVQCGCPE